MQCSQSMTNQFQSVLSCYSHAQIIDIWLQNVIVNQHETFQISMHPTHNESDWLIKIPVDDWCQWNDFFFRQFDDQFWTMSFHRWVVFNIRLNCVLLLVHQIILHNISSSRRGGIHRASSKTSSLTTSNVNLLTDLWISYWHWTNLAKIAVKTSHTQRHDFVKQKLPPMLIEHINLSKSFINS